MAGLLGVTIDARWSLIGHNADSGLAEAPVGSPDAKGNRIGGAVGGAIDPLLGPLVANGGPTQTYALLVGSPALDAGRPASVPALRGYRSMTSAAIHSRVCLTAMVRRHPHRYRRLRAAERRWPEPGRRYAEGRK